MIKKKSKLDRALARRIEWKVDPTILLCPQIPKPMHGLAPRVVLGQKWWDQTRKAAYRSSCYHCRACGVYKGEAKYVQWLEGHEFYDTDYLLGRMTYEKTEPLCHSCHNYIHQGRLHWLLESGQIRQEKFVSIIQHGDRVLAEAGLRKPKPYEGYMADWKDWRLVVFGKEYKPLYRSYEEYLDHYIEGDNEDA